jgi:hypothetical protein
MKYTVALLIALLLTPLTVARAAEAFLVENGQPRAEIIVAEKPQRTARLAAHELQTYLRKISGAQLPIATAPTSGVAVQIYVGRSPDTDKLQVTADGLKDGAYRMISGANWLVLIGDDTEFVPREPFARNVAAIPAALAEWNKITNAKWGLPSSGSYKSRLSLPAEIVPPDIDPATRKPVPAYVWGYDERSSFNAVNGFLQSLGARWYLPGELGEVLPALKTIALPKIDQIVRPDFSLRRFNLRFSVQGVDTAMWAMRLGVRDPFEIQTAHGMHTMTDRQEVYDAHPDWFAMYGGKRAYAVNEKNQLCYSNEELFRETVRNVRLQFDQLGYTAVSVMPPDGFGAMCQCPLCAGKDSPERGKRGHMSDYVWDFVNRVAKEVRKTHPDRQVLNCAYGAYSLPPLKIAKLEPNVLVSIVGGRLPRNNKPEQQEEYRQLRESWVPKTSQPLIVFENYPLTERGWYLPAFTVHSIGESINATKGISQGEDIWVSAKDFDTAALGFNGFLVYFTARMYWGGKEQDADALFREYCRLFYGPAEQEMKAFFEYGEANWQEIEQDKAKLDRTLDLFAAAQKKVETGSVYGRRIALVDHFLKGLRSKSGQLGKKRGPVPTLRLVGLSRHPIIIDGKLDDAAWENAAGSAMVRLRELQTGRQPTFGTTVKSTWMGDNLYFAIRCDEQPGAKLNVASTRKDDPGIWHGDAIEVLLETDAHSYYQIVVNPAGAVTDLDRAVKGDTTWDSQVEVATQVADDHWTVEMRIPVTRDESDPLHQVIGRLPTESLPWHINVCRQRIRENGKEFSAFSPTGTERFHEPIKFAHFYAGRSHQFEAAEPDADFLEAMRAAAELAKRGKHAEAIAAYRVAAEGKLTDLQKSHALELAATQARILRQYDVAAELAERIPIEAVKKTVLIQVLVGQGKAAQAIQQFGREDIASWPFWKIGHGYAARGRAYAVAKAGPEAEADLARAIQWTSDAQERTSLRVDLAENRERTLHDDAGALAAYREVVDSAKAFTGTDTLTALQSSARILTRQGKFDKALGLLQKAETEKLGTWRGTLLLARGETLQAAGRKDEAAALFKAIAADEKVEERQRKIAREKAGGAIIK